MPTENELKNIALNGNTITGEIGYTINNKRNLNDYYRFNLKETSYVNLSLDGLSQGRANLEILGENQKTLLATGDDDSAIKTIQIPLEVGEYYIRVFPYGGDNTPYQLSGTAQKLNDPDNNSSLNQGKLILPNRSKSEEIGFTKGNIRDQDDFFFFNLKKQGEVTLNLDGLNQNADLQVLGSSGEFIFSSTEEGTKPDKIVSILDAGKYYVRVQPNGEDRTAYNLNLSVNYQISQEDDQIPGTDLGVIGKLGRTIKNSVGQKNGNQIDSDDYFKISIAQESVVNLVLDLTLGNADLELYESDGTSLISASINSKFKDEKITSILESGDYYVRVKSVQGKRAEYSLNLSADSNFSDLDDQLPGNLLDFSQSNKVNKKNRIGYEESGIRDENDYYYFDVSEKSQVILKLDGLSNNANLALLNSQTQEIIELGEKPGNRAETLETVLEPGKYYVRVYPSEKGKVRTEYRLEATKITVEDDYPNPETAKVLGVLDEQIQVSQQNDIGYTKGERDVADYYSFEIGETSNLNLTLDEMTGNGDVELLDSNFQQIGISQKGSDVRENITVNLEAGIYYVRVFPGNEGTGTDYKLQLKAQAIIDELDTPETAKDLGNLSQNPSVALRNSMGFSKTGQRDIKDYFKFTLDRKSTLDLTLDELTSNGDVEILDSSLQQIAISQKGSVIQENITVNLEAGSYYVRVFPGNDITRSEYRLNLKSKPILPDIQISTVELPEGNPDPLDNLGMTNFDFTVSLSEPSDQTVKVDYSIAGIQATVGEDFAAPTQIQSLIFNPEETSKTISVPVFKDTKAEKDESFNVKLSNAVNGKLVLGGSQAIATIINDDFPQISIADTEITEADSGVKRAQFTVSLDQPIPQEVKVSYATVGNTANVISDYKNSQGLVAFRPNQTSQNVFVYIKGDKQIETDETFSVNLVNPQNAIISDGEGVGTILDNDYPFLDIADTEVLEGENGSVSTATFQVKLKQPSTKPVSVDYTTVDGLATTGEGDYQQSSGTLTFNPQETEKTITVNIVGDDGVEGDETFKLSLSNPVHVNFVNNLKNLTAKAVIKNDDYPQVNVSEAVTVEDSRIAGKTAIFNVTLSQPSPEKITLKYSTLGQGGTATANDFTGGVRTLTIPANKTSAKIIIPLKPDQKPESDETFFLNFTPPINAELATSQVRGIILDNDDENLQRDLLTGTTFPNIFLLTDINNKSLYTQLGESDYAIIENFEQTQDKIQLQGKSSKYQLAETNVSNGLIAGMGIYQIGETQNELIAIIKDINNVAILGDYFQFI